MNSPRLHLLYFKALLDKCFIRFFDDFNNSFSVINNQYVFSKDPGKTQLKKIFKAYLAEELKCVIRPYSIIKPEYFIIIGSCQPKDNILLNYKEAYFPEKLNKLINSDFQLKYLLKEKDIKLDLIRFNSIFIDIFNELFSKQDKLLKLLGSKDYKNVFFIQHNKIDCYSMFKLIKFIYGKSNCWNIHKEKFYNIKSPIIAINELIDKYIHNKNKITKSNEFKYIIEEVKQFIDEKILGVIDGK